MCTIRKRKYYLYFLFDLEMTFTWLYNRAAVRKFSPPAVITPLYAKIGQHKWERML